MSLDFLAPAIFGLFAPFFLLRRPLTGEERRSVRSAVLLWAVGVAGCAAFVAINRHQLKIPVVIFGNRVGLLWAGIFALMGAGMCLEAGERSRRREAEKRLLRQRDGLPEPRDGESPEEESRRLLAEVERLRRANGQAGPDAASDGGVR